MIKNRRTEITVIAVILIIQTIIYAVCGANKSYIHMDEAYSMGLASYDKVEIQANEDFYNIWHKGEYYEDYMVVNSDETGEYSQVYVNQKNDVHPPLYYLFLRFAMGFFVDEFSMWHGIIINIIIYLFITVFVYLISKKVFAEDEYCKEKSALFAFLSSLTLASATNAIYIRMYALSALTVLAVTYLHIRLLEEEKAVGKWLALIGLTSLIGSLTHYYFLFYLFGMFLFCSVKYFRNKQYKNLLFYVLSMIIAGISSLLIFPYSIQHMFFGYRGEGFISKLLDIKTFIPNVGNYIAKLNEFAFNGLLFFMLAVILLIIILKLIKKKPVFDINSKTKEVLKLLYIPSAVYFFFVSVASPWIELRYIASICAIVFIIVCYYFYMAVKNITRQKTCRIISFAMAALLLLMPFILKNEPQVMYSNKKELCERVQDDLNVPTVYFFNSSHNRFLDDILLFAYLDESYIAKDVEMTAESYGAIMEGKDISKGVLVFINPGQSDEDVLKTFCAATGLKNVERIQGLNACEVYYVN